MHIQKACKRWKKCKKEYFYFFIDIAIDSFLFHPNLPSAARNLN